MNGKTRIAVFVSGLGCFACLTVLVPVTAYSRRQLSVLSGQTTFDTPEAGMVQMYGGQDRTSVTGVGDEVLSNLRYVGAVVESGTVCSGGQLRCSVGGYFLEIDGRWVFVAEGRVSIVIAVGQKIRRLLGLH